MHVLNNGLHVNRVHVGHHAVAEVEDVSRSAASELQNIVNALLQNWQVGVNGNRSMLP